MELHCQEENDEIFSYKNCHTTFNVALYDIKSDLPGCLGKKSERAKALENYEKFLDLWKDADPGIAEIEDARKRLAGLQSQ